jgi:hypothetical protein
LSQGLIAELFLCLAKSHPTQISGVLACPKLCRKNGGDLEQIKFLLGHSSIQATERYLGSEQDIEIAVNDNLGL